MNDKPREPYDLSGWTPSSNRPVLRLRRRLMLKFPQDVAKADAAFSEYWDFDRHTAFNGSWLDHFANTTNQAMTRRDQATIDGHLAIMRQAFNRGGSYLRSLIDSNYVENLFYNVKNADARWAWQRVPAELQQLYISLWGPIVSRFVDRLQPRKSKTP
jgi:hypothetical protein